MNEKQKREASMRGITRAMEFHTKVIRPMIGDFVKAELPASPRGLSAMEVCEVVVLMQQVNLCLASEIRTIFRGADIMANNQGQSSELVRKVIAEAMLSSDDMKTITQRVMEADEAARDKSMMESALRLQPTADEFLKYMGIGPKETD